MCWFFISPSACLTMWEWPQGSFHLPIKWIFIGGGVTDVVLKAVAVSLLTDLCWSCRRSHIFTVWPPSTRGETGFIWTSRRPQIYCVRYALFALLRLIVTVTRVEHFWSLWWSLSAVNRGNTFVKERYELSFYLSFFYLFTLVKKKVVVCIHTNTSCLLFWCPRVFCNF